jgi:hypothetical protein
MPELRKQCRLPAHRFVVPHLETAGFAILLLETSLSPEGLTLDLMQVERDRRKALKVERDALFARYVNQPKNIQLAVEIKALDDEIAKSVEGSSSHRQRTSLRRDGA